ncbi:MAG TPA: response regulator [Polyangia bacterium]
MAKKKRTDSTDETSGAQPEADGQAEVALALEVGSIVHDLRNVFSAIRGCATVISEELRPGDPARDDIDQILKAVDRGVTVSHRLSALRGRVPAPLERPLAPVEIDDTSGSWKVHQPKRSASILIIEDDELLRPVVARVLRRNGYAVAEAASGAEAEERALAAGFAVDLLLVDVGLPGLSGPEVVGRLQQRWPAVKVLFMSGFGRTVLAEEGLAPGPHLLEKPFSPTALIERIEALLAPGTS